MSHPCLPVKVAYQPPLVVDLGSVSDLTQGSGPVVHLSVN